MATVTTTQYGSYTHGTPYRTQGASYTPMYSRNDTYHSSMPDLDGTIDHVRVTGLDDDTGIYTGPYNGACSSCWLNHTHSTAYHAQSVRRA